MPVFQSTGAFMVIVERRKELFRICENRENLSIVDLFTVAVQVKSACLQFERGLRQLPKKKK